jgi:hypothetical protein
MSNNAVINTFDSNLGSLSHAWNIQGPSNGAVTLGGGASMMEWATGRDAGHGYGTYTVTAKVDGSQPGPGIILWPGDNQWPGQEVDMLEITPDGSGRQSTGTRTATTPTKPSSTRASAAASSTTTRLSGSRAR